MKANEQAFKEALRWKKAPSSSSFQSVNQESASEQVSPLISLLRTAASIVSSYITTSNDLSEAVLASTNIGKQLPILRSVGRLFGASNNWVVHGSKTTTGKPVLCNDPHLGFSAPSIWILMHLQFAEKGGHEVMGSSFAGLPGVSYAKLLPTRALGYLSHMGCATTDCHWTQ